MAGAHDKLPSARTHGGRGGRKGAGVCHQAACAWRGRRARRTRQPARFVAGTTQAPAAGDSRVVALARKLRPARSRPFQFAVLCSVFDSLSIQQRHPARCLACSATQLRLAHGPYKIRSAQINNNSIIILFCVSMKLNCMTNGTCLLTRCLI